MRVQIPYLCWPMNSSALGLETKPLGIYPHSPVAAPWHAAVLPRLHPLPADERSPSPFGLAAASDSDEDALFHAPRSELSSGGSTELGGSGSPLGSQRGRHSPRARRRSSLPRLQSSSIEDTEQQQRSSIYGAATQQESQAGRRMAAPEIRPAENAMCTGNRHSETASEGHASAGRMADTAGRSTSSIEGAQQAAEGGASPPAATLPSEGSAAHPQAGQEQHEGADTRAARRSRRHLNLKAAQAMLLLLLGCVALPGMYVLQLQPDGSHAGSSPPQKAVPSSFRAPASPWVLAEQQGPLAPATGGGPTGLHSKGASMNTWGISKLWSDNRHILGIGTFSHCTWEIFRQGHFVISSLFECSSAMVVAGFIQNVPSIARLL